MLLGAAFSFSLHGFRRVLLPAEIRACVLLFPWCHLTLTSCRCTPAQTASLQVWDSCSRAHRLASQVETTTKHLFCQAPPASAASMRPCRALRQHSASPPSSPSARTAEVIAWLAGCSSPKCAAHMLLDGPVRLSAAALLQRDRLNQLPAVAIGVPALLS